MVLRLSTLSLVDGLQARKLPLHIVHAVKEHLQHHHTSLKCT